MSCTRKVRLNEFDIARGLAMIAIVIGHSSFAGISESLVDFCYSFDVPLFFFISGYFCREHERVDLPFLKKNAIHLIVPYFITSALMLFLLVLRALLDPTEGVMYTFVTWVKAIAYGSGGQINGMPEDVIGVGAIWFLLALFWAKILLAGINETKYPAVFSLVLFVIGISTRDAIWLPWSIQPALCAVLFMYAGQRVRVDGFLKAKAIPLPLWACLLFAWLYCGFFCGQLYMVSNTYSHGAIDVVGGIAGSLCIVKISELFSKRFPAISTPFIAFGRITLPFFCAHLIELNVIRWDYVIDFCLLHGYPAGLVVLIGQFICSAIVTALLYCLPASISGIFFSSRRKRMEGNA